jgi:methylthioribose-1-phosphate isomerase
LGVIRAASAEGKCIQIIATETRPALQGSRLTTFELSQDNFHVTLISDTMVGSVMSRGFIDKVIVGADRITKTGHIFNKIGTYQVAVLAKRHNVPFYCAAPVSTFDLETDWSNVIIEERSADEICKIGGKRIAPKKIKIFNPAFDMTPPEIVTAIITEEGVLEPDFKKSISESIGS